MLTQSFPIQAGLCFPSLLPELKSTTRSAILLDSEYIYISCMRYSLHENCVRQKIFLFCRSYIGICYRGSFAVVKVGIPKDGSEQVAIKIIDKKVCYFNFKTFVVTFLLTRALREGCTI